MNTKYIIDELKRNKIVFKDILEGLKKEVYLWKPNPEKWCVLEVVCHLYDEEREIFRVFYIIWVCIFLIFFQQVFLKQKVAMHNILTCYQKMMQALLIF